ncbi:pyruvate kinase [Mariprofundus erugo]|uniref:Pyruvate kinase n=1 Tax=Mariprofundus erugo TaxID=2528639 RepID=A0A5R9GNJ6_9PROT|nr:pyruvate kinase [Mariprofundus erugo]TLS66655.1 pyruvate kinase [Mariprofundus erugo]TLS73526.1 pyruvate kinase [Mariprofundus erugo]
MSSIIRRTKIVATLGPASESPAVLDKLVGAGVNVVRLNFSHGTPEEHQQRAENVRAAARKHGVVVGILADMQGPKIRIGKYVNGKTYLEPGQKYIIDADLDLNAGNDERVGITYKELITDVKPGDRLLLNDGLIVMDADAIIGREIHCTVVLGGELSNNKGINKAGGGLSAEALTEKDKEDIKTACAIGADYIAISFPRHGADMEYARKLVREAGGHAGLVAKVERAEAVEDENLKSIMEASDAVMVARGDLGVEIGDAAVPPVQKKILRMAPKYNCPVIVATQMMESMCNHPIPTRAEVNDVANAVLDGADAVMLSGESAAGKYPVEAVAAMHRTCVETEKQRVLPSSSTRDPRYPPHSVDECIARQAMETAHSMPIRAIAAFTDSGNTVLYMSRHLGDVPIYALTPRATTLGRVTLFRNVTPLCMDVDYGPTEAPKATVDLKNRMLDDGLAEKDDLIVMTFGTPMGHSGGTNAMKIIRIGDNLE